MGGHVRPLWRSPTRAVWSVLRRSLDFRGRSGRAEFWWWQLFTVLVLVVWSWLDARVDLPVSETVGDGLYTAFELALALPTVSVGMRRLHDVGLPGWPAFALEALTWLPGSVLDYGSMGMVVMFNEDLRGLEGEAPQVLGTAVPLALAVGVVVVSGMLLLFTYGAALLPSRRQSNRWGPPPGMVRQAEVFS